MVTDFEYDGVLLSEVGYALMAFDGVKDGELDTDSQITFNHMSMMRGKYQPFSSYIYDDVLKMEFYIGKDMCRYGTSVKSTDYNISVSEMAFLKRWLSRPTPHVLRAIGDDSYTGVFWRGSFIVEEYTLGDGRIGAHLTFECDAPFGYMDTIVVNGEVGANEEFVYNCTSDEVGYIYPKLNITLKEDGDLRFGNGHDERETVIKNCVAGEVITITENLQISSSVSAHKIMNDFNFVFYRVSSTFRNVENSIKANLPIEFTIEYNPYAKVVIV